MRRHSIADRASTAAPASSCGIGIGVPGFIDMDTGIIMRSPNLQDWANFPVRQEIEKRLNTKVILENDANAAAMGEKWLGAGRNTDHMAMYTLGTGVGGGIVLNGRLWHGINGMAGELGHFNIESEGHPCGCGSRGCLEQYASATAIVRMAHEAIDSGNAPDLADLAQRQRRVHFAQHLPAGASRVIRRHRRFISAWDARWLSASAPWSTRSTCPCT